MKIRIKRLDKSLPLPEYHTSESAGFDLYAAEDASFEPKEDKRITANLIIQTPPRYMLLLTARSSLAIKKGLLLSNGVGIIDSDHRGSDDIIKISMLNYWDKPTKVEKGERIAQGIFIKIERAEWEEVDEINAPSRGGFGSTGGHYN